MNQEIELRVAPSKVSIVNYVYIKMKSNRKGFP